LTSEFPLWLLWTMLLCLFPSSLCQFTVSSSLSGPVSLPFWSWHSCVTENDNNTDGLVWIACHGDVSWRVPTDCVFLIDLLFMWNHICSQIWSWCRRRSCAKWLSRRAQGQHQGNKLMAVVPVSSSPGAST
jgi:hypothetical protein